MNRRANGRILALAVTAAVFLRGLAMSADCAQMGDPMEVVLQYCGEPSQVDRTVERGWRWVYPDYEVADGWVIRSRTPVQREVRIRVEYWTYNYGRTKFVRILRFEDGLLRSWQSGGYGW